MNFNLYSTGSVIYSMEPQSTGVWLSPRQEATEDSDIDFLSDYDVEKITPWFSGGLLADLEQLFNRKMDVATVDTLKERIRDRVLREVVTL